MALRLVKRGEKINLTKAANNNLKRIRVGLGWNPRSTAGDKFDLDASALRITTSGRLRGEEDIICYGMEKDADGKLRDAEHAVEHTGDNKDGGGEGDDEQIIVNLEKVPAVIERIIFPVTIYAYRRRKQNFGMVDGAFIRIIDDVSGEELLRFNLTEDYSTESALEFGAVYRKDGGWSFDAIGQGYSGGLAAMLGRYGLTIDDENDELDRRDREKAAKGTK